MKTKLKYIARTTLISVSTLSSLQLCFAQLISPPVPPSFMASNTPAITIASTSEITKKQIKQPVSKLSEIPAEKREALEGLPLAKTTFTAVEQLLAASAHSEGLIKKVESFLALKKASGMSTETLETSLADSKNTLETANTSISIASNLTEVWATTLSTSTYKKAVITKKIEYRAALDSARQNIKKTNLTLRNIVSTLASPLSNEVTTVTQGAGVDVKISEAPGATPAAGIPPFPQINQGTSSLPLSPSTNGTLGSTSTPPKKIKVIEQ